MRGVPASLLAHKRQPQQTTCVCWRVELADGTVEGYTSLDRALTIADLVELPIGAAGGATLLRCVPLPRALTSGTTLHFNSGYTATLSDDANQGAHTLLVASLSHALPRNDAAPIVDSEVDYVSESSVLTSQFSAGIALASNPVDVTTLKARPALGIGGVTPQRLFSGAYNNARVKIFEVNYADNLLLQTVLTRGVLGKADSTDAAVMFQLDSLSAQINRTCGRTVQGYCDAPRFGEGRCFNDPALGGKGDGPDMGDGTHYLDLAVVSASGAEIVLATNSKPNDWSYNGVSEFRTGDNAGKQVRVIKYVASTHTVTLEETPYFEPQAGDTFRMREGCGRSIDDCDAKGNSANFQGFPFVPGQEGAIKQYVQS